MSKQKRGAHASMTGSGNRKTNYNTLHGDIAVVREKSILFMPASDPDSEVWIPRSVIENESTLGEEDDVDINIADWFCIKEGIE